MIQTPKPSRPAGDPDHTGRWSLRARVLPTLIASIGLLLGAILAVFFQGHQERLREAREVTAERAAGIVRSELENHVATMSAALEAIADNEALAAPMRAGDRQRLLAECGPLFETFRERFHIEHFYFHRPDRTNLVRIHEPDHHDDRIDRFTLAEAERTGQTSDGIEQGPTGNCTLRVVRPWRVGGELLGYIELGTEFGTVAEHVHDLMHVDLVFAVDKSRLRRDQWESRNKKLGRQTAWDEFPDAVIIDTTLPALPAGLASALAAGLPDRGDLMLEDEDRTRLAVFLPLPDMNQRSLGSIVVLHDITRLVAEGRTAIAVVSTACAVIGGALVLFFYVFLGRIGRTLHDRTLQLAEANATLEARVQERTAELKAAHEQLLGAARKAGMAEVAAGVLHNVGNVLNSVNVAVSVAADKVRRSEVASLVQAGEIIREHRDDLPAFLTTDERGKHLPGFLIEVARCLGEEQTTVLKELDAVAEGMGHIKHVIGVQQAHAKQPSLLETAAPDALMDSALQMQRDSLARHTIEVDRLYSATTPVLLDKHRVLQILVNLISNAKSAMESLPPDQRRLALAVREEPGPGPTRRICFEVRDNGAGIPPENLSRIFAYGFTTRGEGHGFGLHSAATAAQEMGGSLTASSGGPGQGAAFLLVVPAHERAPAAPTSPASQRTVACTAS